MRIQIVLILVINAVVSIIIQYNTQHLFEQRHNSELSTETVTQPDHRGAVESGYGTDDDGTESKR